MTRKMKLARQGVNKIKVPPLELRTPLYHPNTARTTNPIPLLANRTALPTSELIKGRRVAIPAAIKREIKKSGKCGFVDEKTGESCDSRYFLEIDHAVPVAMGGTNELKNLRLRCRAHSTPEQAWNIGVKIPEPELFIHGFSRRLVL
jgi:hypothetical protein